MSIAIRDADDLQLALNVVEGKENTIEEQTEGQGAEATVWIGVKLLGIDNP